MLKEHGVLWVLDYVSKTKRRAFSMNSSWHATRKKSFLSTAHPCQTWLPARRADRGLSYLPLSHSTSFVCAPSKSKLMYKASRNSVIGSRYLQGCQYSPGVLQYSATRGTLTAASRVNG